MKDYIKKKWQFLWSNSSKTWVKNVNLRKKVLEAVKSGSSYNNIRKDKREFGQNLSVLEVCLEETYDVALKMLKRSA